MYGEPHITVEEMATHYIDALRAVAKAPYLLGGWSFGGLVAFEMAQQLYQAGEEVALLALFDTFNVVIDNRTLQRNWLKFLKTVAVRDFKPFMYYYLAQLFSEAPSRMKSLSWSKQFATLARELRSLTDRDSTARRILRTIDANNQAIKNYVPQPYAGRVTLFRTQRPWLPGVENQSWGWNKVASSCEVHLVPGDHLNLMRTPQVEVLASKLSVCIDQALARNLGARPSAK